MEIFALSDIGRQRENNEDSFFTYKNELLIGGMVADGIGGNNSGEVASKMAVDLIKNYIISQFDYNYDYMQMAELLKMSFLMANKYIYDSGKYPNYAGMGTTATLALIYRNKLIVLHVGDSRCYQITPEGIEQITQDHSFVAELVRKGQISETEAREHPRRNMITRALGSECTVKVDTIIKNYDNQTILLCSDGLTNMLSDRQIFDIYNKNEKLELTLQDLVDFANKKGGNDNITVVSFRNLKGETKQ